MTDTPDNGLLPVTLAIRDSLVTFWGAGASAARSNKEAPPQAFEHEAVRLTEIARHRISTQAPNQAVPVAELYEVLQAMVDEQCEYARLNNLGDPEKQHNIKRARAVLAITAARVLRTQAPNDAVKEILEAGYARAVQSSPGFRVKVLSETIITALAKFEPVA